MNSLKEKGFKLSYRMELDTNPRYPLMKEFSTCLGIIFNSEIEANNYLDLLALRGTILETNLVEIEYTPRNSVVYATTRSWER
jgi:hypothetical protein